MYYLYYCNNPKYLDRQAWANSLCMWHLVQVYTVCHSSNNILDKLPGSEMDFSNFRTCDKELTQQANNIKMTHWRWYDVILMLCAHLEDVPILRVNMVVPLV